MAFPSPAASELNREPVWLGAWISQHALLSWTLQFELGDNGEALLGLLVFIWSCSPSTIHEVTAAGAERRMWADVKRRRASGSDTTRASKAVPLFELSRNNLHESQASSQPIGSQSLPPHLASPPPPHYPPSLLHHASANQDLTHSDRASEGLLWWRESKRGFFLFVVYARGGANRWAGRRCRGQLSVEWLCPLVVLQRNNHTHKRSHHGNVVDPVSFKHETTIHELFNQSIN